MTEETAHYLQRIAELDAALDRERARAAAQERALRHDLNCALHLADLHGTRVADLESRLSALREILRNAAPGDLTRESLERVLNRPQLLDDGEQAP